jgi:predicted nucleotidyltransferase
MRDELLLKKDYSDIIKIFLEENVTFLLIGGISMNLHGYVRATKDLDLWVQASKENAPKIIKALAKFGAPMKDISAQDFEKEGTVFQIGVVPIRIDIITQIAGIKFDEAIQNAKIIEIDGINIPTISLHDLIKNKKATGRLQDLADAEKLEQVLKRKS